MGKVGLHLHTMSIWSFYDFLWVSKAAILIFLCGFSVLLRRFIAANSLKNIVFIYELKYEYQCMIKRKRGMYQIQTNVIG